MVHWKNDNGSAKQNGLLLLLTTRRNARFIFYLLILFLLQSLISFLVLYFFSEMVVMEAQQEMVAEIQSSFSRNTQSSKDDIVRLIHLFKRAQCAMPLDKSSWHHEAG
jgi:hypothetical protein